MTESHRIAPPLLSLAVPVDLLDVHGQNPRRGNVDAVAASYKQFGQTKSIVAVRQPDGRGQVIAGNHQLMAARQLGWSHIAVTFVDFDETQAKAYLLADNRTAEVGDTQALLDLIGEVRLSGDADLLAASAWTDDAVSELEAMLKAAKPKERNTDPDDVPDLPVNPVSRIGDVWTLGEHRLAVGDSTDPAVLGALMGGEKAQMMWTDPPYGVEYVGKTVDALRIKNDGAADLPALLAASFRAVDPFLIPGAAVAIAHPPGALSLAFDNAFVTQGWRLHQTLIWLKDTMVLGHSDYHFVHEPITFGYTQGGGRRGRGGAGWYGSHSETSVLAVPRPKRSEQHPTMKPVDLIARMLANSCPVDGLVLDPFGGSGSTLVAAHTTGRRARLVELDPHYADVIVERYEAHTGITPMREQVAA